MRSMLKIMDALTEGRVAHVGARPLSVEDFLAEGRVGGRGHHGRRAVERDVRVLEVSHEEEVGLGARLRHPRDVDELEVVSGSDPVL